jgi:ComF family protein
MLYAFASLTTDLAAAILSPATCAACSTSIAMRTVFCSACAASIVFAPDDEANHVAAFMYGGAVAEAITAFKYTPRADLARPLADLLARGLPRLRGASPHVVIPVPLHPSRLAERGFNQSALLARPIARALDATFAPLALMRTRNTPRQASLDRSSRAWNVDGAFRVRPPYRVQGAHILLVDDVRTTGSTIAACEGVLREAGAASVRSLVIARTDGSKHDAP